MTFLLFQKEKSAIIRAFISGFFGLAFGTLCSVPYFIIGGVSSGLESIASGLAYDVIRGIGNFVVSLILFRPLYLAFQATQRIYSQVHEKYHKE